MNKRWRNVRGPRERVVSSWRNCRTKSAAMNPRERRETLVSAIITSHGWFTVANLAGLGRIEQWGTPRGRETGGAREILEVISRARFIKRIGASQPLLSSVHANRAAPRLSFERSRWIPRKGQPTTVYLSTARPDPDERTFRENFQRVAPCSRRFWSFFGLFFVTGVGEGGYLWGVTIVPRFWRHCRGYWLCFWGEKHVLSRQEIAIN